MDKNNLSILRQVLEQSFDLTDVCPQYSKDIVGATNVFCVFHDNRSTPSGKLYFDEERGITVLHCFSEHRTFTAYDYVNLILVNKRHKYSSVQDFLLRNLGEQKFNELYSIVERDSYLENETLIEQTVEYVNNLYNEHDNVIDFINCLYLEKE